MVLQGAFAVERAALIALPPAERSSLFGHLHRANLDALDRALCGEERGRSAVVASALLRRIVHGHLAKRAERADATDADAVLAAHTLPEPLRARLVAEHGHPSPPLTWLDHKRHLEVLAAGSTRRLWELVEASPWLEYVPVQCAHCGEVIPDDFSAGRPCDESVGLREVTPTAAEAAHVRAGWFRGPRGAVAFELRCRACARVSRWYRSSSPTAWLNPHRWGRLCGEQEDLRAWLADACGVPLRTIVPLDWDHVWSEARADGAAASGWDAPSDESAANFCCRLDEGIGAWTGVLAVGAESEWCACVTEEYLRGAADGGRADAEHAPSLGRYRAAVEAARADCTGTTTQARTLNGHVVWARAGFGSAHVTSVLRRAAADYGTREWWELADEDVDARGRA